MSIYLGLRSQKIKGFRKKLISIFLNVILTCMKGEIRRFVCSDNIGYGNITRINYSSSDLIIGYFQTYRYLDPETLETLRGIRPKHVTPEESINIDHIRQVKPIIVHIRLGDYESEPGIGLLGQTYYRQAIAELMKVYPSSEVWIFSNDIYKAQLKFGDLFPSNSKYVIDTGSNSAIILEQMRYGCGYIIANSTFSYWAAMLSYSDSPYVVAPKPWFLNAESPEDIIPPYWHTIKSV